MLPDNLSATQRLDVKRGKEKEHKDDKYKTDKTGQYVSKDVQVTGYEDGRERPTRPKYDFGDYAAAQMAAYSAECVNCEFTLPPDEPCDGCGGGSGSGTTVVSDFIGSDEIGGYGMYPYHFPDNINNYIQDLKVIKGSSSTIGTSDLPGYYKIPVDLNRGAGGKYIYLCFTRDPMKVKGSDSGLQSWVNDQMMGRYVPVKTIYVRSYNVGGMNGWPTNCSPPIETKDAFGYHTPDLNDGARGKYIYAYQEKCDTYSSRPVREVGVIYGNSSSIQPPAGWEKIPGDLNEGAGGDFIYFCVKY